MNKKHFGVIACIAVLALMFPCPVLARIDYYGFYHIENDQANIHFLNELAGENNIVMVTYSNTFRNPGNFQALSDRINQNGYTSINLVLGVNPWLLTNKDNFRTEYLQQIKLDISRDSNLIKKIARIDLTDEVYGRLYGGQFNDWFIFSSTMTMNEKVARLKTGLEEYIADIKRVFPGIPVTIVESWWGDYPGDVPPGVLPPGPRPPPSNLDWLGLDAYLVATSPNCDSIQRAEFDAQVTRFFNSARSFGKPIYLVGNAFDRVASGVTWLSVCQLDWYVDLAKNDPAVIGLDWYTYASGVDFTGARDHPITINHLKLRGREILALAPIDIGLRAHDGSGVIRIAAEPTGTVTSPLRIRKGSTTFGIQLVDPNDPRASKIIIKTPSGLKALKKL